VKHLSRWLLLCVALTLALACSSAKTDSGPGGSSSDGGSGTDGGSGDESLGTPPLVVDPDATAMAISLSLVKDSSGTTAATNSTVSLFLEPPMTVHVLAVDWSTFATLGFQGTYSLTSGGSLTMTFKDSGFTRSGTIAFDATQPTVTLPFQVFSADKGTSTWTRRAAFVGRNLQDLFDGLSAEAPNTTTADRAARVAAYATRYVQVHADVEVQALRQNTLAPHTLSLPWYIDPILISAKLNSDGTEIILEYADGSTGVIVLYETSSGNKTNLTMSPLASDPRASVSVTPASDTGGDGDPMNHTALIFAPFDSARYYGYYPGGQAMGVDGMTEGFGQYDQIDAMQALLEGDDTHVTPLKNAAASVDGLIGALGNGSPAPGFIYFSTHGLETGTIATGDYLNLDEEGVKQAIGTFTDQLITKYPNFTSGLLAYACVPRQYGSATGTKDASACYVGLTPAFFTWLTQKRGVYFGSSLVLMDACLTDKLDTPPRLRDAFGARAYFGFKTTVSGSFGGAVFQYFVKSLLRHTHSAEEAYYNIVRIANAGQTIYPEDSVFQGVGPVDTQGGTSVLDAFHGYFAQGSSTVDYQSAGWLDTPMANPGSIWLLLFGARGGGSAANGTMNLTTCWNGPWKMGSTGELSTWCYDNSPGYAPHPPEVGYANYLLTGNPSDGSLPAVSKTVPRWTLNDKAP
jgi:hypothetical protein